jgi:hypothetical protein
MAEHEYESIQITLHPQDLYNINYLKDIIFDPKETYIKINKNESDYESLP